MPTYHRPRPSHRRSLRAAVLHDRLQTALWLHGLRNECVGRQDFERAAACRDIEDRFRRSVGLPPESEEARRELERWRRQEQREHDRITAEANRLYPDAPAGAGQES